MDDTNQRRGRELPFVRARLGGSFERRVVTVAPGDRLAYDEEDWYGSIIVVEEGEIEFECVAGGRRHFAAGDILWMDRLDLRTLHNPGPVAAVLVAIRRLLPL